MKNGLEGRIGPEEEAAIRRKMDSILGEQKALGEFGTGFRKVFLAPLNMCSSLKKFREMNCGQITPNHLYGGGVGLTALIAVSCSLAKAIESGDYLIPVAMGGVLLGSNLSKWEYEKLWPKNTGKQNYFI